MTTDSQTNHRYVLVGAFSIVYIISCRCKLSRNCFLFTMKYSTGQRIWLILKSWVVFISYCYDVDQILIYLSLELRQTLLLTRLLCFKYSKWGAISLQSYLQHPLFLGTLTSMQSWFLELDRKVWCPYCLRSSNLGLCSCRYMVFKSN